MRIRFLSDLIINSFPFLRFFSLFRYDKARPSYPLGAVAKIVSHCKVDPATCVIVDVACGTGKFSGVLGTIFLPERLQTPFPTSVWSHSSGRL